MSSSPLICILLLECHFQTNTRLVHGVVDISHATFDKYQISPSPVAHVCTTIHLSFIAISSPVFLDSVDIHKYLDVDMLVASANLTYQEVRNLKYISGVTEVVFL
jgi:hypothetical protein